ncbi:MAG: hypothetical protein DMG10_30660 [Acidobacteria bacterium]|nr:MAG: hypothetical protein DMG10_30660 [Acidobacteriota bacterium]
MLAKYPKLISQIPPGTIVVPWGYDATVYEPYWAPFASLPIPKIIATGVSIWNSIAPDFDVTFSNIDSFLEVGRPHGILGVINTIWTDDILVLMRPAFPGIAYGAAAAWQRDPMNREHFFDNYARAVYPAPFSAEVAAGLKALTVAETHLSAALGEETSRHLWDPPFAAPHLARLRSHREDLRQARLEAEQAQEHLSQALRLGGDHFSLADFLLEARMLDYAGLRNIYALEIADIWQQMGSRPKSEDVNFYLSMETASHDHSRTAEPGNNSVKVRRRVSAMVELTAPAESIREWIPRRRYAAAARVLCPRLLKRTAGSSDVATAPMRLRNRPGGLSIEVSGSGFRPSACLSGTPADGGSED